MGIDIKHIAKLSRLYIEDEKVEKFESDMLGIVQMVENLPDVEDEPLIDPANPMTLREDKAEGGKYSRDELTRNAPHVTAGCLVVPKTVE
ncbi:MAG: Asp-tRNA(Asn)/Glu-tRNA(Gln) amidotransferase subunit GatC [Ruminococcus sp.]|nr:Asp-tRNA(Asn)/Glu-tRNA(Gln) amidotransferase subunit GatC [Ruminococcus sp.]